MNDDLERLFAQIHSLEADIEQRLDAQRAQFKYRLAKGKAVFEAEVAHVHRRMRTAVWRYLREAALKHLIVAPVIYAMVVPIALLDLSFSLYQQICFRAWGISRVRRRDYVVLDRHRLGYLNAIEKLNCVYCGYANGVLAYAREIAGRTEQYWCPIRHALRVRAPHAQYRDFLEYGDAAGYRARLEALRARLR